MTSRIKHLWPLLGLFLGALLVGVALAGCQAAGTTTNDEGESVIEPTTEADEEAEDQTVEAAEMGEVYDVTIKVKDYGTIEAQLYPEVAPQTVENFVKLAKEGFYDGLTFHRIMDGFMIQGGDPTGTGMGGSDENVVGEFAANGYDNPLSHTRGVLSMARANDPNSASSQFFIVQSDSEFLDGNYAAFGKVTSGMDVVDKICEDAQPTDNNGTIPASEQPVIESITVTGPVEQ